MAIKFQYNKTSLGELGKQLKMRQKALPTIKSKESALRSEVKKAKDTAQDFQRQLDALTAQYDYMVAVLGETRYILVLDARELAAIGTDDVLHLPHIEHELRRALLS